jgi:hypothetical protein
MRLNDFSCRIPEGQETHSGYVEMRHGKQYSIQLRNDRDVPCDAKVSVDGKEIGVWRISPKSGILLERPAEDHGRFTFYELGTDEAVKAKLHSVKPNDLGLVQVLFTPNWTMTVSYLPRYNFDPHFYRLCDPCVPWTTSGANDGYTVTACDPFVMHGSSRVASMGSAAGGQFANTMNCSVTPNGSGGTGLSGHSQQAFSPVGEIALDHSTTITLRLIIRQSSGVRELRPTQNANPVPPAITDFSMCPSCWPMNTTGAQRSREFIKRRRKPYGAPSRN